MINTPLLSIETFKLYYVSKHEINASSVIVPFILRLFHAVLFQSSPLSMAFILARGVGSLSVMKGIVKFTNLSRGVDKLVLFKTD